jgi:hypothetical protein
VSILQLAREHLEELSQLQGGVPQNTPKERSTGTPPNSETGGTPGTGGTGGTFGTPGTAEHLERAAAPASAPTTWVDALLALQRPESEPPARWVVRCAGVRRFVDDGWHRKAAALGWSHDELFGRGSRKLHGAAWFIEDDRVLFVTGDQIMARRKGGFARPIFQGVDYSGQEGGR